MRSLLIDSLMQQTKRRNIFIDTLLTIEEIEALVTEMGEVAEVSNKYTQRVVTLTSKQGHGSSPRLVAEMWDW